MTRIQSKDDNDAYTPATTGIQRTVVELIAGGRLLVVILLLGRNYPLPLRFLEKVEPEHNWNKFPLAVCRPWKC